MIPLGPYSCCRERLKKSTKLWNNRQYTRHFEQSANWDTEQPIHPYHFHAGGVFNYKRYQHVALENYCTHFFNASLWSCYWSTSKVEAKWLWMNACLVHNTLNLQSFLQRHITEAFQNLVSSITPRSFDWCGTTVIKYWIKESFFNTVSIQSLLCRTTFIDNMLNFTDIQKDFHFLKF